MGMGGGVASDGPFYPPFVVRFCTVYCRLCFGRPRFVHPKNARVERDSSFYRLQRHSITPVTVQITSLGQH